MSSFSRCTKRPVPFGAAILATVLAGVIGPVQADPIFEVTVSAGTVLFGVGATSDSDQQSGATPVGASAGTSLLGVYDFHGGVIEAKGESSAVARAGVLAASAHGFLQSTIAGTAVGSINNGWVGASSATARSVLDDLIVTGPTGGSVLVSLTLALSGTQEVSASVNPPMENLSGPRSSGASSVGVAGSLAGVSFSGQRFVSINDKEVEPSISASGLFAGFTGNELLTSPVAMVTVGVPFSLMLDLSVGASAVSSITHGNAVADTGFGHTLSFPDFGPVFNLPDGFTLNSESGLIVNNLWVGGPQVQVPEPSSLVLLLIGVGLLAVRRGITSL